MENVFHIIIIHYLVSYCKTRNETETKLKQVLKRVHSWCIDIFLEYYFSQSILVIYPNNNRCVFVYVSFHFVFVLFRFVPFRFAFVSFLVLQSPLSCLSRRSINNLNINGQNRGLYESYINERHFSVYTHHFVNEFVIFAEYLTLYQVRRYIKLTFLKMAQYSQCIHGLVWNASMFYTMLNVIKIFTQFSQSTRKSCMYRKEHTRHYRFGLYSHFINELKEKLICIFQLLHKDYRAW